MSLEVIHIADEPYDASFAPRASAANVICIGDSLTGWNNFGRRQSWPFPTFPEFLQDRCASLNLLIADGGVAGEVSGNGPQLVRRYLDMFPNARYVVLGFGTNDLGMWQDLEQTSESILANYGTMLDSVRSESRVPILLNVPGANERLFTPDAVADLRRRRDFHNGRLVEFCAERGLPLVDIRSPLVDADFDDELHPNEHGARKIAGAVFEVLRDTVEGKASGGRL